MRLKAWLFVGLLCASPSFACEEFLSAPQIHPPTLTQDFIAYLELLSNNGLIGNLWQWTDKIGTALGEECVGGCFASAPHEVPYTTPFHYNYGIYNGFRLVRTLPETP